MKMNIFASCSCRQIITLCIFVDAYYEIVTNKVFKHYFLDKTITFDDDTNERIEGMFNELTEEKYEIEATNISSIKKADLETELDRSFVNQLVCFINFGEFQALKINKIFIFEIFYTLE